MNTEKGIQVYYDTSCSFCLKSLKITEKLLDIKLELKSLNLIDEIQLSDAGITESEKMHNMIVLDNTSNRYYIGYFGFKFLFGKHSRSKLIRFVFNVNSVIFDMFGKKIYRIVANNRSKLGCESESCSIHRFQNENQ